MEPRLTFLITDLHRGGSPLLLADLAPGLQRHGFDVEVVSIAPEGEVAGLLRARSVPVYSLNAEGRGDFSVVPRFANYVRRARPDIVASVLIHANLLAVLARPFVERRVLWVHSIHTLQERPRWHWYVQGVLNSFADGFVAPSAAIVRKLAAYGPMPQVQVIPNGIDVARFALAEPIPVQERPWPADAFVVGFLGRFDPVKRIPLLIRAATLLREELPRLHVALVGYGQQEAELRQLKVQLGLEGRLHFVPPSPTPERWYRAFDVFCSPSAAEGYGLTLAEATCAGLAVIACDTPAVRETLENAVWIPEDATPQAVARAIRAIFKKYEVPRGSLEKYSARRMVDAYARHFWSLLGHESA